MSDTAEKNKGIVTRFNKEFIEQGDVRVFEEIVAEDFINHDAQAGATGDRKGSLYFFTQILRTAFPDLEVTILDQIAENDRVVTRKRYRGTHQDVFAGIPATGKVVEFGVIDILRLRDGQYIEHWAIPDMAGLMRQLNSPGA